MDMTDDQIDALCGYFDCDIHEVDDALSEYATEQGVSEPLALVAIMADQRGLTASLRTDPGPAGQPPAVSLAMLRALVGKAGQA